VRVRGEKGKEGRGRGELCIWARWEGMVSCMTNPGYGLSRGMHGFQGGSGHISPLKGALSNQCSAESTCGTHQGCWCRFVGLRAMVDALPARTSSWKE